MSFNFIAAIHAAVHSFLPESNEAIKLYRPLEPPKDCPSLPFFLIEIVYLKHLLILSILVKFWRFVLSFINKIVLYFRTYAS